MRKNFVKSLLVKITLMILILLGAASFFMFQTIMAFQWIFAFSSILAIIFYLKNSSSFFVIIVVSFSLSYLIFGLASTFGLPLWALFISLAGLLSLIIYLVYSQLQINISNFNSILLFYLIITSEIILALSFWLVNPLTKSLILSIFSYLFSGYLLNESNNDNIFIDNRNYIYVALIIFILLLFTVSWGR